MYKGMRKILIGLAVAAVAGHLAWTKLQPKPDRLKAALAEAKKENKLVLLDFTGSDWCEWCMKLDDEALGKPEFISYAANYLVTLVVDFPMHHELAPGLKKANKTLSSIYGVSGFPTLVALSPDGKVVWRHCGYLEGGPFGVIAPLNRTRLALGLPEPAGLPAATIAAAPPKSAPAKVAIPEPPSAAAVAPAAHGLPATAPKLQGIFYSRSKPSVMLGGWQCNEGDSVGGMRVVKIMQDKVTVEWQGRTEELTMD